MTPALFGLPMEKVRMVRAVLTWKKTIMALALFGVECVPDRISL